MEKHLERHGNSQGRLNIYTLGQFEVRLGAEPLTTDSRSSKMWDLLKFLITHRERSVAPEVLVETLWPDEDFDDAKGALRTLVYRLRKVLAPYKDMPHCILSQGGGYRFDIDAVSYLDAEEFERLSTEGLQSKALDILERAMALYQGDYLKDALFVEWAIPKRTAYRRLYLKIIAELVHVLRDKQMYERAEESCARSLLIEPLDEGLNCHCLELFIAQGKYIQAQEHYSNLTSRLYRDMGIKPSPALRSIYDTIKSGQIESAATRALPEVPEGALICAPEVFSSLCDLEAQRGLRHGHSVFVVEFTFNTTPERWSATLEDKALALLVMSLRRGDAVAKQEGYKLAALLSNLPVTHAERVANRLCERVKGWGRDFSLEVKCTFRQL